MVDFLRMDELLSDEERMARESVREFVTKEFLPRIQEHVRQDGSFPMELVPQMAELGLFGANLRGLRLRRPEQRRLRPGDAGARARRLGPALVRLGAGLARACIPIHAYGTEAQKERWLPAHGARARRSAASA